MDECSTPNKTFVLSILKLMQNKGRKEFQSQKIMRNVIFWGRHCYYSHKLIAVVDACTESVHVNGPSPVRHGYQGPQKLHSSLLNCLLLIDSGGENHSLSSAVFPLMTSSESNG